LRRWTPAAMRLDLSETIEHRSQQRKEAGMASDHYILDTLARIAAVAGTAGPCSFAAQPGRSRRSRQIPAFRQPHRAPLKVARVPKGHAPPRLGGLRKALRRAEFAISSPRLTLCAFSTSTKVTFIGNRSR